MALAAACQWEVRTTGSDTECSGGFKAGAAGTDYSQQNAAQKSGADLAAHASDGTKVRPVAAGVAAADVGNVIQITDGAGWTKGFYEITAQDGTYWTVAGAANPSAAGNANAGTYYMGGALASPGKIGGVAVTSNIIFSKGNQTITTASTNVSGGCISHAGGLCIVGYDTTRTVTNTDTRPVWTIGAGVSSATIVTSSNSRLVNLSLDGGSNTSSKGTTSKAYRCHFANFTNGCSSGSVVGCSATGCASVACFSGAAVACEAYGNTIAGFTGAAVCGCLAYGNTGATVDGFSTCADLVNCVSYGNGRDGFRVSTGVSTLVNCIAESNTGYGFTVISGYPAMLANCAVYSNTGGTVSGLASLGVNLGFVTVTVGSVFTNAAAGDFSLNSTANRGALLRAAGYPATFPVGLTASYRDIGAAQHADPASGGGPLVGPSALISV